MIGSLVVHRTTSGLFILRTIWVVGIPYSSDRGEMELCRELVCNSRRILLLFLDASGNGGFPLATVDGKP